MTVVLKGELERQLVASAKRVAGVDEVGRGCIAGPVFAGSVVLNYDLLFALKPEQLNLIRDSKTLSRKQRATVLEFLPQISLDFCIGISTVREIERLGIVEATFLAMRRALAKCSTSIDVLLVDGNQRLSGYSGDQRPIVDGDAYCYAVAAASIVAKEARDSFMQDQSRIYPEYGFESHVGYGTKAHLARIEEFGICPLHRKSFAPIANHVEKTTKRARSPSSNQEAGKS